MTVEMNPHSGRRRPIRGTLKHGDDGARKPGKSDVRQSDDISVVNSLNSWTENLSQSNSSSSESGSFHGSSPSQGGRNQEVKLQVKSSRSKLPFCKEEQKPMDTPGKAGPRDQYTSRSRSRCTSSSSTTSLRDFEVDSSLVTSLSLGNYDYQYDPPINDPDLNCFIRYGNIDGKESKPFTWHQASFDKHVVETVGKERTPTIQSGAIDSPPPQPESLYPKLTTRMTQESLTPSEKMLNDNKSESIPKQTQQRSHYCDKAHNSKESDKSIHFNTNAFTDRTCLALPHQALQGESELTSECFSQYSPKRVESNSHQGSAALIGRLHKSQPSINTTPLLKRQPKSASDLECYRQSFEHRLEPENVKTAVKSLWNNLKYGWRLQSKPNIKYDSPLFMLGKCYHRRKEGNDSEPEGDFLKDFASRIWLTYRSKFYPIPGTKLITDCGWGCMLRSGQMLIAQCLVTHFLGRDWRLYDEQTETQMTFYREIIRWFSDPLEAPSDKTPFCLHHLAHFGRTYNKDPGEWYGPASVAYIFRDAFTRACQTLPILSQLCVYVAQDCTVYIDDVIQLCTGQPKSEGSCSSSGTNKQNLEAGATAIHGVQHNQWLKSLIILIPMRLGGEVMNEIYIPCVKSLLSHDNCMGIIGGKPKHSLYFLGWQDDKLIYLDPHLCREAVDTSVKDFKIESYHCMTPRKLTISKMDPSCTVGFYIRSFADFQKFVREVAEFISPPKQKGTYPLFIFSEGSHLESSAKHNISTVDRKVRVTHFHMDENGQRQRTFSQESEDFVML